MPRTARKWRWLLSTIAATFLGELICFTLNFVFARFTFTYPNHPSPLVDWNRFRESKVLPLTMEASFVFDAFNLSVLGLQTSPKNFFLVSKNANPSNCIAINKKLQLSCFFAGATNTKRLSFFFPTTLTKQRNNRSNLTFFATEKTSLSLLPSLPARVSASRTRVKTAPEERVALATTMAKSLATHDMNFDWNRVHSNDKSTATQQQATAKSASTTATAKGNSKGQQQEATAKSCSKNPLQQQQMTAKCASKLLMTICQANQLNWCFKSTTIRMPARTFDSWGCSHHFLKVCMDWNNECSRTAVVKNKNFTHLTWEKWVKDFQSVCHVHCSQWSSHHEDWCQVRMGTLPQRWHTSFHEFLCEWPMRSMKTEQLFDECDVASGFILCWESVLWFGLSLFGWTAPGPIDFVFSCIELVDKKGALAVICGQRAMLCSGKNESEKMSLQQSFDNSWNPVHHKWMWEMTKSVIVVCAKWMTQFAVVCNDVLKQQNESKLCDFCQRRASTHRSQVNEAFSNFDQRHACCGHFPQRWNLLFQSDCKSNSLWNAPVILTENGLLSIFNLEFSVPHWHNFQSMHWRTVHFWCGFGVTVETVEWHKLEKWKLCHGPQRRDSLLLWKWKGQDRHGGKETGRVASTKTRRQADRQTEGQQDTHTDRQTDRQTDSQTVRQSDSQTVRQSDSQTVRQSDSQTVRQTERQLDRQTHPRLFRVVARCVSSVLDNPHQKQGFHKRQCQHPTKSKAIKAQQQQQRRRTRTRRQQQVAEKKVIHLYWWLSLFWQWWLLRFFCHDQNLLDLQRYHQLRIQRVVQHWIQHHIQHIYQHHRCVQQLRPMKQAWNIFWMDYLLRTQRVFVSCARGARGTIERTTKSLHWVFGKLSHKENR